MKLEITTYIMRDSLGDLNDEQYSDTAHDFAEFLRGHWFDCLAGFEGPGVGRKFQDISIDIRVLWTVGKTPEQSIIVTDEQETGVDCAALEAEVLQCLTDENEVWDNYCNIIWEEAAKNNA